MLATRTKRNQQTLIHALAAVIACSLVCGERAGRGQPPAGGEAMFRQLDADGNGRLLLDEATDGTRAFVERIFKTAGKAPTGSLTRDEFLAAYDRQRNKPRTGQTPPPSAQSSADRQPQADEGDGSSGQSKPVSLEFADTGGDGAISRAEWSKFKQSFSHLDADKNNSLEATELSAAGGSSELLMKLADLNRDDKVSRVEWTKLVQSFGRFDADKDNSLDVAELQKVADAAVASASGSASLSAGDGKSSAKSGPTLWRGRIEGRGQIELLVSGNRIDGRETGGRGGGDGGSLGAGTFTMTGDGKSGNMDAVYTEGRNAGEACLGIYKLEGDTLLWCVNNRGGRPQSFSGGGGNWLLTLSRVPGDPSVSSR